MPREQAVLYNHLSSTLGSARYIADRLVCCVPEVAMSSHCNAMYFDSNLQYMPMNENATDFGANCIVRLWNASSEDVCCAFSHHTAT